MRKVIASVLACTVLAGCVYPPPPGYRLVQGYGTVAPVPVVTGQGRVESGPPPSQAYAPGYAPGYAYDPGLPVYAAPVYAAPAYVEPYPDYAGAAVTGLAVGALAGVAIGSACCYGGYGRGWGGYRGGYGGGYGGGWRGGHRR